MKAARLLILLTLIPELDFPVLFSKLKNLTLNSFTPLGVQRRGYVTLRKTAAVHEPADLQNKIDWMKRHVKQI